MGVCDSIFLGLGLSPFRIGKSINSSIFIVDIPKYDHIWIGQMENHRKPFEHMFCRHFSIDQIENRLRILVGFNPVFPLCLLCRIGSWGRALVSMWSKAVARCWHTATRIETESGSVEVGLDCTVFLEALLKVLYKLRT